MKYEFHPLTKLFPIMPEHERDELGRDMKTNSQLLPIILYEGKILDGRNRYLACLKFGLKPRFVSFTTTEAKKYVIGLNYYRRHLTREQKHGILMRLIAEKDSVGLTQKEIARAAGVSRPTVARELAKQKEQRENVSKRGGLIQSVGQEVKCETSVCAVVDDMGFPVPVQAQTYWDRRPEAKQVLAQLQAARGQVKKLIPDDPMWCEVNLNGVIADLSSAINRFHAAVPAHVCPYCGGVKVDDCKGCKGRGVVSQFMWKMAPKEFTEKRVQKL
jgi:hypothetical protein